MLSSREDHPTIDELEAFLERHAQKRSSPLNIRVVRHLLAGCDSCRNCLAALAETRFGGSNPSVAPQRSSTDTGPLDYDRAFEKAERTLAAFLENGRPVAQPPAEFLSAFLPGSEGDRLQLGDHPGSRAIIDWLVRRSHEMRYNDPDEMLHWGLMARIAADSCSASVAGSRVKLADLRAKAWAQFANALRVKGYLSEAGRAMATAWNQLEEGSADLELQAFVSSNASTLCKDEMEFNSAIDHAETVERIGRIIGDSHQVTVSLILKGNAQMNAGNLRAAAESLGQAARCSRKQDDWSLRFAARHNLIHCFLEMGRPDLALPAYLESQELRTRASNPLLTSRTAFQEGWLLRCLGHGEKAERPLLRHVLVSSDSGSRITPRLRRKSLPCCISI